MHFCGVKLLAWKSGGVNFLTNIMSAWGCRGQGVRRPQEAFQREGKPEVFWYQLVGPGTFTRVIDISREEAWHKQTDGPKNDIMGFAEQSLENNFAQMPACLWAGSASFTVARSCRSTVALEILTRLSSLTAQRTQALQVDANTGPRIDNWLIVDCWLLPPLVLVFLCRSRPLTCRIVPNSPTWFQLRCVT